MTESEFWASTYAKVLALYDVQVLDWHRTRDYFVAHMISLYFGAHSGQGQTVPQPEDILKMHYPSRTRKGSKQLLHDPDHGALGDWRALRDHLKDTTTDAKQRRAKLRPRALKR